MALISILWVIYGYSLVFVGDGAWLGTLERFLLAGMTMDGVNSAAKTIPEALFVIYQMTFAIITVALVAGSVADRMRFSSYVLFASAGLRSCTFRSRTGCGAAAFSRRLAFSILPAVSWSISAPAPQASSPQS